MDHRHDTPGRNVAAMLACCRCGRDDQPWDRIAGKAYCAGCQESLVLGEAPPLCERTQPRRCLACKRSGTVPFETFPLSRPTAVTMDLCGEHLWALLRRALGPPCFSQLCRHFRAAGVDREQIFLLHHAFYDQKGRALQPVTE